jgi:hypothetical protein
MANQNNKLLQTHYYDGKLKYTKINNLQNFNDTINDIKIYIKGHHNESRILITLNLLSNDRKNNIDNINKINVEDLLPHVWQKVKDYDTETINVFYEQLIDIVQYGSCAQGRTTRLIQFL